MSTNVYSRGCETILLVEDDPLVLNAIIRILTPQGYRVLKARNPKTALQFSGRHDHDIDLLLTDVILPGLYGWQLAELMKLDQPELKVLYISSECDDIQELGDTSELILHTPFPSDELRRAVRNVLNEHSLKVASPK